jgi:hypothetical protein
MRKTHTKEAHVKDDVKALLNKYEWFWFMPPSNAYGKSGIADIIAVRHGTFLAVETKFGSNKPTPMQIGFLNSIRANDGFAMVVTEKNLDWFDAFLDSFEVSTKCAASKMDVPPEHGARMLNALMELSNKLLDTPVE